MAYTSSIGYPGRGGNQDGNRIFGRLGDAFSAFFGTLCYRTATSEQPRRITEQGEQESAVYHSNLAAIHRGIAESMQISPLEMSLGDRIGLSYGGINKLLAQNGMHLPPGRYETAEQAATAVEPVYEVINSIGDLEELTGDYFALETQIIESTELTNVA